MIRSNSTSAQSPSRPRWTTATASFSVSEPIRYGAVSTLQRPSNFGLVPVFGVPDIAEAEVVLFGPEEWDVIEGFMPTEDVVRRSLALALGDDPMFDANSLTGKPVRPARDVAGSEDALACCSQGTH